MSYTNQFKKELHSLFDLRTAWLMKILGAKKIGKPTKFNKDKVKKSIQIIQNYASKAFVNKISKYELDKSTKIIKNHKIQGHGIKQKKKDIKDWYDNTIHSANCVYMFFNKDNKCLYVGRSSSGKHRPASHCEKFWFKYANRIKVVATIQSESSKIECMAIHRYLPRYNINTPSKSKWTKKCPICKIHKDIKNEIESIF